jgi:hypothetical protein
MIDAYDIAFKLGLVKSAQNVEEPLPPGQGLSEPQTESPVVPTGETPTEEAPGLPGALPAENQETSAEQLSKLKESLQEATADEADVDYESDDISNVPMNYPTQPERAEEEADEVGRALRERARTQLGEEGYPSPSGKDKRTHPSDQELENVPLTRTEFIPTRNEKIPSSSSSSPS